MSEAASAVKQYLENRVLVITSDGRCYVGKLKACDQATNIVLAETVERIFSTDDGVKVQYEGMYVLRGDHIASIGEIDNDLDNTIDLDHIRAEPIKPF